MYDYEEKEKHLQEGLDCAYLVYGREVCPTSNRPHLQGYVCFRSAKTRSAVKKALKDNTVHLEDAKGNSLQNFNYCTKEGRYVFEKGVRPMTQKEKGEAGKRKWAEIAANAKAGNFEAIRESDPRVYITQYSAIKRIAKDHMVKPPDLQKLDNLWIYGPHHTGKSHRARQEAPDGLYYSKPPNKWWCGYQGEPVVILEDIDEEHSYLGYSLKIWADKYSFIAEEKNGAQCIRPQRIIVTSNYHPNEIFLKDKILDAILRRFKLVQMTEIFPETNSE